MARNRFDELAEEFKNPELGPQLKAPEIERGIIPSFKRGWSGGVAGQLSGEQPQPIPQDESFLEHLGALGGGVVSDFPGMFLGGLAGEAVGGPIGAAAGAFGAPALINKSLQEYREHVNKGNDLTFGEFLERAGRIGKETSKSMTIGAATGAVSKLLPALKMIPGVDKWLNIKYAVPVTKGALQLGAMTGTKAALEGKLPDKQEVLDNAMILGGFKLAEKGGDVLSRNAIEPVFEKGRAVGRKLLEAAPESISKPIKEIQSKIKGRKEFWNLLEEHIGNRNAKLLESQFKWRDELDNAKKAGKIPKKDLEEMIYYRQKTGNPEIKGDTYEALNKRLQPQSKRFVDEVVDKHLKNSLKDWNENPVTKDINPREGLAEIYLPGLYEFDPQKFTHAYDEVSKRFKTRNPFSNEKKFLNYLDAFKTAGLKPRYKNIIDLMKAYDSIMIKSTVNSELANKIKNMEKQSGEKLVVRSTDKGYGEAKANGYVQMDDPYLRRYVAGTDKNDKPIWATTAGPVLVHPDFASTFQGVFTKKSYKQPGLALRSWDAGGNFLRTAHVRFSPFHYAALGEHGASTIGARRSLGNLLGLWSKNIDKLRYDKEFMTDAAKSGLVIHTPVEDIKRGGHLFTDYHPRLKIASWKQFVDKEVGRLSEEGNPPDAQKIAEIKRDAANITNDIFGGQNWEVMPILNNPNTRAWARRAIGYIDWTTSAIKNAANIFSPGFKGIEARKTWMRYGINYMIFQGAMRFLMSGWENKDPKDPNKGIQFNPQKALNGLDSAKNDPTAWYKFPLPDVNVNIAGHTFNPGRDADNRRLYSHTGKQALEITRWFDHFVNEFFSKSNPLVQMIWKQVMGITPYEESYFPVQGKYISGKYEPWEGSKPWTQERFASRIKELAKEVLPYGIQGIAEKGPAPYVSTMGGALPVSKGMSLTKSDNYIEEAMRSKDTQKLNSLARILHDNGYKAKQIKRRFSLIRNRIKKEIHK